MEALIPLKQKAISSRVNLSSFPLRELLERANPNASSRDYSICNGCRRGFIVKNEDLHLGYELKKEETEIAELSFYNLPREIVYSFSKIPALCFLSVLGEREKLFPGDKAITLRARITGNFMLCDAIALETGERSKLDDLCNSCKFGGVVQIFRNQVESGKYEQYCTRGLISWFDSCSEIIELAFQKYHPLSSIEEYKKRTRGALMSPSLECP